MSHPLELIDDDPMLLAVDHALPTLIADEPLADDLPEPALTQDGAAQLAWLKQMLEI